jgi:hypothetical protein
VGQLLALTEGAVPADVFEAAGALRRRDGRRADRPEVQGGAVSVER